MSFPFIQQQTIGEPLANPWYTPGWTSQHPDYQLVPTTAFDIAGFPSGAIYITVSGNYFDIDGNPVSGYLTFWPSTALTLSVSGGTTVIPQRRAGINLYDLNGNLSVDKMFMQNGRLLVNLMATDNASVGLAPANFTYHVIEHFLEGREYDISVPSTSVGPVDINTLIIPGSEVAENPSSIFYLASVSTMFVPANITTSFGGVSFNPESDEVDFAFIAGPTEPTSGDWNTGEWVGGGPPFIAQILVGPENGGLVLAPGSYVIWCRVIASPQVPVFSIGTLVIY